MKPPRYCSKCGKEYYVIATGNVKNGFYLSCEKCDVNDIWENRT